MQKAAPVTPSVGFSPLPVQVPTLDAELDEFELRSVGSMSRRSMRRLRAAGLSVVLAIEGGYTLGQLLVAKETPLELEDLPECCPCSVDDTIDDAFLPE